MSTPPEPFPRLVVDILPFLTELATGRIAKIEAELEYLRAKVERLEDELRRK